MLDHARLWWLSATLWMEQRWTRPKALTNKVELKWKFVSMNSDIGTKMAQGGSAPAPDNVYVFPVTFAQQRLWFLDELQPNSAAYNVSWPLQMTGNLNVEALQRTLDEIVRRHEVL